VSGYIIRMNAEIISIGTELTSGKNLDTNTRWLSQQLAAVGIPTTYHTTVADDLSANVGVFRTAIQRATLVLATGGLGPTLDDLTRGVIAEVAGVSLVEDTASLEIIRGMFEGRFRTMPERNRQQAMFPVGSVILPNAIGTAPGVWMDIGGCLVVAMPGVPREMMAMYHGEVLPRLRALGHGGRVLIERKLNLFGLGESHVEEQLGDMTRRGAKPEVGITASDATISLRILTEGANEVEALAAAAPVEAAIRAKLGNFIFSTGDTTLHEAVMELLKARHATVATAESLTAGLVAHRLSQVPGVSAHLLGGIVAYTDEVKVNLLDVPQAMIATHTAVSEEVARAMAEGVRRKFGSTFGLATTGYAGPDGGTDGTPVGTAYIAVAQASGTDVQKLAWFGNRTEVQSRTAKSLLNRLRLHLIGAI